MRIEVPSLPTHQDYFPLELKLSLTPEEATKLASIRRGMFEADCRHSEVCEILCVEDVIHCWIQSAVAEDAAHTDEHPPVVGDAPRSTEPAPV